MKEGATDFVVKPWDNAKLIATLLSAYRLRQSQTEVKQLREKEEILKKQLNTEEELISGDFAKVKITGALEYDLIGELL